MILPTIAFILFALSCALQALLLLFGRPRRDRVSWIPLLAGGLLLLAELARRSLIIGFVAVTNTYEALVLFAAAVAALASVWRLADPGLPRAALFGGSFAAFCLLALASSPLLPKEVLPPVPALQSGWLVLHISLAFVGEAFFAFAFAAAIVFLLTRSGEKRERLDRLVYTAVLLGYPVYTLGALVFGAIWAHFAWGSFWSWDPKEIWALVTWLAYTLYLHVRLIRKRRGAAPAIIAVIAFLIALFTFLGVNYLMQGLHSYV